jgi:two-component system chemotaxis response regulator CheY
VLDVSTCKLTAGPDDMTKILVVDDSLAMRQDVSSTLMAAGFDVVDAGDGAEGLEVANANSDIALIILDLNMPRMDGLAFMEAMRSSGKTAVPTVMLTTEAHPSMIEKAKKAGAKGWLVKPVKREHLVAVARRLTSGAPSMTESGISFVLPRLK